MDGVLYDRDLRQEIVKNCEMLKWRQREFPASTFRFILLKLCEYIPKSLCFTFVNGVEFIRYQLSESFAKLVTPHNIDFQLLSQYVNVLQWSTPKILGVIYTDSRLASITIDQWMYFQKNELPVLSYAISYPLPLEYYIKTFTNFEIPHRFISVN